MPHGVVIDGKTRLLIRSHTTCKESHDSTSDQELFDGDISRALGVGDVLWFGITNIRKFQNRIQVSGLAAGPSILGFAASGHICNWHLRKT